MDIFELVVSEAAQNELVFKAHYNKMVIRARSEKEAREIAEKLDRQIHSIPAGTIQATFSPYQAHHSIECKIINSPDYSKDGEIEVLSPADAKSVWHKHYKDEYICAV